MDQLFIYHPGTGTLIALSDEVYLVNAKHCDEETLNDLNEGVTVTPREHKGYRIDNYNMTNLFYGDN
jgi:hypothetical protein